MTAPMRRFAARTAIGPALVRGAGTRERSASILGGVYVQTGTILLEPIESENVEIDVDIQFPVKYLGSATELPHIDGSGGITPGQQPIAGAFPTWTVGTSGLYFQQSDGGNRVYTGARLCVVVTGPIGLRSYVTYLVAGRALTNPTRSSALPGL